MDFNVFFEFDLDPALRPGPGAAQNQRVCLDFDFCFDFALRPGGTQRRITITNCVGPALALGPGPALWALGPGSQSRKFASEQGF